MKNRSIKKLHITLLVSIVFCLLFEVKCSAISLDTSSSTVELGDSFTVTIGQLESIVGFDGTIYIQWSDGTSDSENVAYYKEISDNKTSISFVAKTIGMAKIRADINCAIDENNEEFKTFEKNINIVEKSPSSENEEPIVNFPTDITLNKDHLTLFQKQSYTLEAIIPESSKDYITNWTIEKTETSVVNPSSSGENNIAVSLNGNNTQCIVNISEYYPSSGDFIIKAHTYSGDTIICNLYIPTSKELFDSFNLGGWNYVKKGTIIDVRPVINLDAELTIDGLSEAIENGYLEQIDTYKYRIITMEEIMLAFAGNFNTWFYIHDYTYCNFDNYPEPIRTVTGAHMGITINTDYTGVRIQNWNNAETNWKVYSEDESIVRIMSYGIGSGGIMISAENAGETNIVVEIDDLKFSVKVIVNEAITKFAIDNKAQNYSIGDTGNIFSKMIIEPANAYYEKMTYTSSNEDVLTIDENGNYKALKDGISYINISATDTYKNWSDWAIAYVKGNSSNIVITNLPVTSIITIPINTVFGSLVTEDNFPILSSNDYSIKLYSSDGSELGLDSIVGSRNIIQVGKKSNNLVVASYVAAVKGDVSGDGKVKIYDSYKILKDVVSNIQIDEVDTVIRDYNNDENVKIYDAYKFLNEAISQ